jgi:hypothetical protein
MSCGLDGIPVKRELLVARLGDRHVHTTEVRSQHVEQPVSPRPAAESVGSLLGVTRVFRDGVRAVGRWVHHGLQQLHSFTARGHKPNCRFRIPRGIEQLLYMNDIESNLQPSAHPAEVKTIDPAVRGALPECQHILRARVGSKHMAAAIKVEAGVLANAST